MKLTIFGQILDVLEASCRSVTHKVRDIKASLVTTLSVIGILATSGAALAANTKVLDSVIPSVQESSPLAEAIVPFADQTVEPTDTGEVVAVDTTMLDSPTLSVPTDTSVPITDLLVGSTTSVVAAVRPRTTIAPSPGTTVTPSPGTTVAPSPLQPVYNIPGVGIITLRHDSTSLKIVSVNPVSGWTFVAKYKNATRVEVEFENDKRSLVFRAELLDGRVIAAVSEDNGDGGDDSTKDTETAAKIAADAAEKSAKATYDATEKSAKVTYDATERSAKATYDATEREAKEKSDDAALTEAKDTYETALRTAKETFETALRTAKETLETALRTATGTLETALRTAKETLESADD